VNKTTEALLARIEKLEATNKLAEEALIYHTQQTRPIQKTDEALAAIREALAEPDMKDAIIAGNEVLLNEQAQLLRECRSALDSLIKQRPNMAGLLCGSTTLGNLRAGLGAYRPSGVMNGTK